jgi:hypothetical protein
LAVFLQAHPELQAPDPTINPGGGSPVTESDDPASPESANPTPDSGEN